MIPILQMRKLRFDEIKSPTQTWSVAVPGPKSFPLILLTWPAKSRRQKKFWSSWAGDALHLLQKRKWKIYGHSLHSARAVSLFTQVSVCALPWWRRIVCNNFKLLERWQLKGNNWPLNFFPEWLWAEAGRQRMWLSLWTIPPFFSSNFSNVKIKPGKGCSQEGSPLGFPGEAGLQYLKWVSLGILKVGHKDTL